MLLLQKRTLYPAAKKRKKSEPFPGYKKKKKSYFAQHFKRLRFGSVFKCKHMEVKLLIQQEPSMIYCR